LLLFGQGRARLLDAEESARTGIHPNAYSAPFEDETLNAGALAVRGVPGALAVRTVRDRGASPASV